MPRGDANGPMGMGPRTGRAAGYCAGWGVPGFMNPAYGRAGMGYRGWGRGRRNMYYATGLTGWQRAATQWPAMQWPAGRGFPPAYAPTYGPAAYGPAYDPRPFPGIDREQELAALGAQVELMERDLAAARERMAALDSEAPGERDQEQQGSEGSS